MKDLKAELFGKALAALQTAKGFLLGFARSNYRTVQLHVSAPFSAAKLEAGV